MIEDRELEEQLLNVYQELSPDSQILVDMFKETVKANIPFLSPAGVTLAVNLAIIENNK